MQLQGMEKLRSHHHIGVTKEVKEDLSMWLDFINHPSVYCRGFMDFKREWLADEILMFSDAAKSPRLGFRSQS